MTVIINIVLTVGGAFVFGFYGLPLITPGTNSCLSAFLSVLHIGLDWRMPTKMALGFAFGTIVFFADLWFMLRSMFEEDNKVD